jgi:predicted DNA binding CopG/RHH family protein
MAKKRSASLVPGERRNANAKRISDSDIDFSDIPESTPEELKRAVRVGRPTTGNAKQMIAFRIAPGLLSKIRKLAAKRKTPYQTLLHELLEEAVDRKATKGIQRW